MKFMKSKHMLKKCFMKKIKEVENLENSMNYLKQFNAQQMSMLEEADRAFAIKLQQEEEESEIVRLRDLEEQNRKDEELARQMAEEFANNTQLRDEKRKELEFPEPQIDFPERTSTIRSTAMSNASGKPRKKFADHVNVGEKIKLHSNEKGIVKFKGAVHWSEQEMVGLEMTDGSKGTNSGKRDGYLYFKVSPNMGKFVAYGQISHVYRNREKDGKEEKLRFNNREYLDEVSGFMNMNNNMQPKPKQLISHQPQRPPPQQKPSAKPIMDKKVLERMTTEAQIEIAMQNSLRSANQFIREAPALYGVNTQSKHGQNSSRPRSNAIKKEMYKQKENKRLMRNASVKILNEVLDAIDDEEQKTEVINKFVNDRKAVFYE